MSRNAFPQIERDYAEAQALREHAAMEREQVPPLGAAIDSLRAERDHLRAQVADLAQGQIAHAAASGREIDRLRAALARIAAGTVPPRDGSTPAEDYRIFAAEALEGK